MTTAAQTEETKKDKQGENDKSRKQGTKKRKKIVLKAGSMAKKKEQENRTQDVRSNKVSRLCYKAEPGTLSHSMPPSCSRR